MKNRQNIMVKVAISGIILLLSIPMFLHLKPSIPYKPLKGAVVLAEKPELSLKSWFDATYQKAFEKYFKDNLKCRPELVRVRNQIAFSLFDEVKARQVTRGKQNYLYEKSYMYAYNGDDYLGHDTILYRINRVEKLQEILKSFNKTLLVVIAPGKGSYYPEYFPDEFIKEPTDSTNYKKYAALLNLSKVNHIDFNGWFLGMKDTCECMLYPRYGIHWSNYGALLATDSLIKYVEYLTNRDLPNLVLKRRYKSKKIKGSDYDIASGMNLLFQLKSDSMCYAISSYQGGDIKPKTLVIADSFYWVMLGFNIQPMALENGGFWFYNKKIYPDSYKSALYIEDVDVKQRILDNDVVILLANEENLKEFSWGFVEMALTALESK